MSSTTLNDVIRIINSNPPWPSLPPSSDLSAAELDNLASAQLIGWVPASGQPTDLAMGRGAAGVLKIGPSTANGAVTNPVLTMDGSAANCVTGVSIVGAAAGSGATLQATSTSGQANEALSILSKGAGRINLGSSVYPTSQVVYMGVTSGSDGGGSYVWLARNWSGDSRNAYFGLSATGGTFAQQPQPDDTWSLGYNPGSLDATKPAFHLNFESFFYESPGDASTAQMEFHLASWNPTTNKTIRILDIASRVASVNQVEFTINASIFTLLDASTGHAYLNLQTTENGGDGVIYLSRGGGFAYGINNTGWLRQLNATGDAYVDIALVNASNNVQIDGAGHGCVFGGNATVSNGTLLSGSSGNPSGGIGFNNASVSTWGIFASNAANSAGNSFGMRLCIAAGGASDSRDWCFFDSNGGGAARVAIGATTGSVNLGSGAAFSWSSTTTADGAYDTRLIRTAAGVVSVQGAAAGAGSLRATGFNATGDNSGVAATTGLTNATNSTVTNAYIVKGGQAASTVNTGWLKMYVGTAAVWVPYWANATP